MNHFKPKELECKCGCGLNNFSPILLAVINEIREHLGKALIIRSGSRCPKHNKKEEGKPTSDHLTGEGVDLKAIHSHTRFLIIERALELGIRRIGFGKTFLHLGINKNNPQEVFWDY